MLKNAKLSGFKNLKIPLIEKPVKPLSAFWARAKQFSEIFAIKKTA